MMKRTSGYYEGRAVRRRHFANRERVLSVTQREQEQQERERRIIQSMKQDSTHAQNGGQHEHNR